MSNRSCFKCQGLGYIALDYPNCKVITLAEWAAMKEVFEEEGKEEGFEDDLKETQEKIVEEADEREILVSRRVLSGQKGTKDK